jgi:hypothetical protein
MFDDECEILKFSKIKFQIFLYSQIFVKFDKMKLKTNKIMQNIRIITKLDKTEKKTCF